MYGGVAQLYPYRALPIHLSSVKEVPKQTSIISELVIVITLFELINAFGAFVQQCND